MYPGGICYYVCNKRRSNYSYQGKYLQLSIAMYTGRDGILESGKTAVGFMEMYSHMANAKFNEQWVYFYALNLYLVNVKN